MRRMKDGIVLAGVSGAGKHRRTFGRSIQRWSIYVEFSPSGGQYGDFIGQELRIRARPPKYGQTEEQSKLFDMLDLATILRGLYLSRCLFRKNFNTKGMAFCTASNEYQKIQKNLHNVDDISSLIDYIDVIFDEAQVLCEPEYGGEFIIRKKKESLAGLR